MLIRTFWTILDTLKVSITKSSADRLRGQENRHNECFVLVPLLHAVLPEKIKLLVIVFPEKSAESSLRGRTDGVQIT